MYDMFPSKSNVPDILSAGLSLYSSSTRKSTHTARNACWKHHWLTLARWHRGHVTRSPRSADALSIVPSRQHHSQDRSSSSSRRISYAITNSVHRSAADSTARRQINDKAISIRRPSSTTALYRSWRCAGETLPQFLVHVTSVLHVGT